MNYPTLTEWLNSADSSHWLREMLDDPGKYSSLLQPFEEVAVTLAAVTPLRLDRKKRELRDTDLVSFLGVRVELVIAAHLVTAGLTFEFGGNGQPDLVVSTSAGSTCLEITTKLNDPIGRLRGGIEDAVSGFSVNVMVSAPSRPLSISAANGAAMIYRVLQAAASLGRVGAKKTVELPEIGGRARCSSVSHLRSGSVWVEIGPDPSNHIGDLQKIFQSTLLCKDGQAVRGSWTDTILVIDVARLGMRWADKDDACAKLLKSMSIDWNATRFVGFAVIFTDLQSTTIAGAYLLAPCLTGLGLSSAQEVLTQLKLRIVP